MKIKCPFCKEIVNTERMSLYDHWCDYSEFDDVGKMLSDLLVKIHEKIEQFENSDGDSSEITSYECDMSIMQVLKSLLENEK